MTVKWNSYVTMLFIAIVGTIPFTMISMTEYFWSAPSSLIEGINAVLYPFLWVLVSFWMGTRQNKKFLRFSVVYFACLAAFSLIAYHSFFYVLFVVLLSGPFNGLEYFADVNWNFYLIGTMLTLLLITLGYYGGYQFNRQSSNK